MPPRKNDDYMQVDSGEDSFPSDVDEMYNGKSKGKGKGKAAASERKTRDKGKSKNNEQPYAWEASYVRSWDTVQEDEAGSLQGAVDELIARNRRRRYAIHSTTYAHFTINTIKIVSTVDSNPSDDNSTSGFGS